MNDRTSPMQVINGVSFNRDLSHGPYLVDGHDTLVKLFVDRCRTLGERTAHREKEYGIWLSYSWADYRSHAEKIALGLLALGLQRGDCVSIISEDRKEWAYTDLAVLSAGGICTGIYTTDAASQLAYIVNDSLSRFLFVENDEQLDKFLAVRDQMPGLEKVIVIEDEGLKGFSDPQVMFLDDLYRLGLEEMARDPGRFEAAVAASRGDDIAILVYTSGTTGMPKGVMITHENIIFSIISGMVRNPVYETDEQVCFLPLCHILERVVSNFTPIVSRSTVNFAESPETVFDNVQEVSPTVFTAVPRLWEKIYSRVTIMAGDATPFGRWCFRKAVATGQKKAEAEIAGRPVPLSTRLAYAFWDATVLTNLRRMLGFDRLRMGTTGAAPVSPEILKWFRAIGVVLVEGYGMSESSGVISVNSPTESRVGSVGPVIPGAEVRIAENGEIQYRGGNCCRGYWRKPEATTEAFTPDGWLKTGDAGHIDADGFLTITGRIKDIIITAGGKNITPAELENRMKFSPYISDAVVIGDRRKYLTCLVMIDQENVQKFAQDRRVPFSDFASLCARPEVRELIGSIIAEVNSEFARVEQIKDFRLIDILLTAEDEELTATMKLKRGFVEKKHKALIDQMYA
ncbi:AMP-dependent synthetase/ligase [Rhizobium alvei]|uniref:Long-chain fatty acid--CoA ligase n=1 Tax=Rhizobium alvei TaxID=1132659 RepID=A0ABT8YH44_9HYPH|nr:long-chain fatty acid--CoA ligase [Rhizobium alvei]MDO6963001.1 long-chain fatty acid--CoA ligase [Rhizobium alvei]